jgi:MFS family permease
MTRVRRVAGTTFKSLKTRNYRLWFTGQIISVSGTWVQTVAQAWLVLRLAPRADQGIDLGLALALQFLPMLLIGAWGGLIADRFDKRRILMGTQTAAGLLAVVLAILTVTGAVRLWQVFLLALLLGFVNVVDNPSRQSFVVEMVGSKDLANAVSLNSIIMNGARVIGPAIGGVLIATVGIAVCFWVNAASYLAVIAALTLMRRADLHQGPRTVRGKGQLREGLRYAWGTKDLRDVLLVVLVVGTFAYNFTVILPLLAKLTFHGGAGVYSLLTSLMASGAVLGGLIVASRGRPSVRRLGIVGIGFGAFVLALALAPSLVVAAIAIVPMGGLSIAFIATANSTIQLRVDSAMRGRVMSLYAIGFLGTAPLGAPLVGWISQVANPRVALALGAASAIGSSVVLLVLRRSKKIGNEPVTEMSIDALEQAESEAEAAELGVA